ncbi:putative CENPB DNA-binding domain-containing protein 1 [Macrobrachium rosenbergii]|uniref:putative CENPB DNA-binding domain-containing protein 1 n=1 Tax=Macrobrachium rosenbergii TaxID=79674 RepID=UPI0034D5813D
MGPKKMSAKTSAEKKKRPITLDMKCKIIGKHDQGVCVMDLARQYNQTTSTICTILKQKESIKAITPAKDVKIISKLRTSAHEEMEKLLLVWLKEKQLAGDTVKESIICEKAQDIYVDLVQKTVGTSMDEASEEPFIGNQGWFEILKRGLAFTPSSGMVRQQTLM